jgi:hypothetical protein
MQKAIPSPNLTAALAFAALAELVLFRLASHVFLPSQHARGVSRLLADVGLFMSNLAGVLGVVLVAVVLVRALRGDSIFPRSMRITVSTIGLCFVLLATAGVLMLQISDRYVAYLRISHAFLAGFVAAGLWHKRCPMRMKFAVTLFAAPIVLQTAAMFCERMRWSALLVGQCSRLAQASAFFGLLLSPALIAWRPRRGWQTAAMVAAGLISFAFLSLAMLRHFGLAQMVALYGLRFDLPVAAGVLGKAHLAMVVAAYVSVTVAAAGCLTGDATSRLLGYGVLLLAATGHQIAATNQTLFSLCGLCALALGALHLGGTAAARGPTPAEEVLSR